MKSALALASFFAFAACSHNKTPTTTAMTPAQTPAVAQQTPVAQQNTQQTPVSPNVAVSGDLAARCHLHASDEPTAAPKFSYNEFQLLPEDRNILQQVAQCLTRGPLAGHAVKLIGRADPRGTEEYNLSLGTRRAETVQQYLERLGVKDQKLAASTRGAEDATGTDESTWRRDRRVDLELND
jgi:peptidoglycan-associated lipoprotein